MHPFPCLVCCEVGSIVLSEGLLYLASDFLHCLRPVQYNEVFYQARKELWSVLYQAERFTGCVLGFVAVAGIHKCIV